MSISIKQAKYSLISPEDYQQIRSLRYQVFRQRLNWELHTSHHLEQQLESDEYDSPSAEYLYATDQTMQVCGCWRILPTVGKYMLKDTFANLLDGHQAPQCESTYELSRFAVDKNNAHARTNNCNSSNITLKMFQGIYQYAVDNGIKQYVTVTSTSIERILKRLGIPFNRMGEKNVHLLGDTKSIALSIPINQQFMQAVQH